jgi:tetratricopeptide (TPR) repeat protein
MSGKYRLVFTFTFFISSTASLAQYHKIDSIKSLPFPSAPAEQIERLITISDLFKPVNRDSALANALLAVRTAELFDIDTSQWKALQAIGTIYAYEKPRDFNKAINYYGQALRIAQEAGNKRLMMRSHSGLGFGYWRIGSHAQATEHGIAALELSRELKDKKAEGRALGSMSLWFSYAGDPVKAIQYCEQAIAIYKEINDERSLGLAYLNMGSFQFEIEDYDKALSYYREALQLFEKRQLNVDAALSGIGNVYLKRGNTSEARVYYQRWAQWYTSYGHLNHLYGPLNSLGETYLVEKNFREALNCYQKALTSYGTDTLPNAGLRTIYDGLAKSYEGMGDYKNAVLYRNRWMVQDDSLDSRSNKQKVQELTTRLEVERHQQELILAEKDKEFYRIINYTLGTLIFLLVTVGTWVGVRAFRNHRKKIKHIETSLEEIEQKLEESKEKEAFLSEELNLKSSELMAFTLQMIHKNEELDSIRTELAVLKREASTKEMQARITRLMSSINVTQRLDKDWENFRMYFDRVHGGFLDNLRARYPSLSQTDYKLSALIRLNLDTKQMASVLDISPESTKVAKHRLKKKLNLEMDQDLKVFLESIQ